MVDDDFTQPEITSDVQQAIDDAAEYLAECKRRGYLDEQRSFNYARVSHWVECCDEHGEYDDQRAKTVINDALNGDVDAIETLNFLARGLIKSGKPLPLNLRTYVSDYALAPLPTKSRKVIRQRDWYVAKAVNKVMKRGFDPTANTNKKEGRPNASACWIVGQALKSRKIIHLETATIEKAWNDSKKLRDQMTNLKTKVPIGFVGLGLLNLDRVTWVDKPTASVPTETVRPKAAHAARRRAPPVALPWFQCVTFASLEGGRKLRLALPLIGGQFVISSELIASVVGEVYRGQGRNSLYPRGLLTEHRRTARSSARFYIMNRPIRQRR